MNTIKHHRNDFAGGMDLADERIAALERTLDLEEARGGDYEPVVVMRRRPCPSEERVSPQDQEALTRQFELDRIRFIEESLATKK